MVQGFHANRYLKNRWFVMKTLWFPCFDFLAVHGTEVANKVLRVGDAILKAREGRFVDENGSTTHTIHGAGIFTYMNG